MTREEAKELIRLSIFNNISDTETELILKSNGYSFSDFSEEEF